jgi:hypothetical protein
MAPWAAFWLLGAPFLLLAFSVEGSLRRNVRTLFRNGGGFGGLAGFGLGRFRVRRFCMSFRRSIRA